MSLTPKKEKFCQEHVSGKNYSDAYRAAFDTSNMARATVWDRASDLGRETEVRARINELRKQVADLCGVTRESLRRQLFELYEIGSARYDLPPSVAALKAISAICGYDKQTIVHEAPPEQKGLHDFYAAITSPNTNTKPES